MCAVLTQLLPHDKTSHMRIYLNTMRCLIKKSAMPCRIITDLSKMYKIGVFFSGKAKKKPKKYLFVASNAPFNDTYFFMRPDVEKIMFETEMFSKTFLKFGT